MLSMGQRAERTERNRLEKRRRSLAGESFGIAGYGLIAAVWSAQWFDWWKSALIALVCFGGALADYLLVRRSS